jgi:opacity protein-like surface antigen
MGFMGTLRRTSWLLLALGALAAAPCQAQPTPSTPRRLQLGVHGNISDDADLGVGGDIRWAFLKSDTRLALVGSFDYFFPEDDSPDIDGQLVDLLGRFFPGVPLPNLGFEIDRQYWEANLDLTYDFGRTATLIPYVGVGANYAHAHVKVRGPFPENGNSEDDFGANVLAGVRIGRYVFVQAKKEAGGGDLFVLTAGVRF